MATPEQVSPQDTLEIIFAHRNRAYGAYQLRRAYPRYLGRAFAIGLLLIGTMLVAPHLFSAVRSVFPDEQVHVVAETTRIQVELPPPPPPMPELPTPPPPVKSTVAFLPPVVKPDPLVQDEPPKESIEDLEKNKADIGSTTREGDDEAPPTDLNVPAAPGPQIESKVQEPEEPTYQVFDLHKPPSFPGGERELLRYLSENIKYPPLARESNIQGSVVLQFVIGKDGSVTQVEVMKDPGGMLGKEAMRVVQNMPRWTPGEANGHPVKVRFTLPVRFRLE